jgi:hypothetical protein
VASQSSLAVTLVSKPPKPHIVEGFAVVLCVFGDVLDDDVADVLLSQAVGHDAPGLAPADNGDFLARHDV